MRLRAPALMLAWAASLLIPAASALSLGTDSEPILDDVGLDDGLLGVGDTLNESLPLGLGHELSNLVQADAHVDAAATPVPQPPAPSNRGAKDAVASVADQVAEVAAPAAGFSLVALLFGVLAGGLEGVRTLQVRLFGWFGRIGRALVGGLGALALFSRLERGSLLDNPVRARVHDVIAQDPGLSLSDLSAKVGIAWGTTVHHLRRLESHGLVVSTARLGHRRYFLSNTPAAQQRMAVVTIMHPTARRIAHLVSQRPGIDQSGICTTLGLNNPSASKHLSQFESQGLVLSQRAGRSRLYHPTGNLHSALLLAERPSPIAAVQAPVRSLERAQGAW